MMNELRMIPLSLIDPPAWVLRDFVPHAVVALELLEQVKEDGNVSQSILVRPTGKGRYEVVDGFSRYTQLKAADVTEAPCMVQELTYKEAIIKQVQLNSTRRPTDSIDYLRTFLHLMELEPEITLDELAEMFTKSVNWVREILRLGNLTQKARMLVKQGEINATNAHTLARINQAYQDDYLDAACTMSVRDFQDYTTEVVNKHREKVRTENLKNYHGGIKQPHMRPMHQIKAELESWGHGALAVLEQDLETPLDGFKAGVLWVMSLDPESLEIHQRKFKEREAQRTDLIKRLRERNHRFDK